MKKINLIVLALVLLLAGCQEKQNLKLAEEYVNHFYNMDNYDSVLIGSSHEGLTGLYYLMLADNRDILEINDIDRDLISLIFQAISLNETIEITELSYEVGTGIEGTEIVVYKIIIERYIRPYQLTGHVIFDLEGNIVGHYISYRNLVKE